MITLSAVIRFYFGLTGVQPATPHKTRIPARASRVFTGHKGYPNPNFYFSESPATARVHQYATHRQLLPKRVL